MASAEDSGVQELIERLISFRDARDWGQFHTLKNLAAALSVESAELLELTQWKSDEELLATVDQPGGWTDLQDEIADVLIYLLLICEKTGIDPMAAAYGKIEKNEERYSVEKSRGSAKKYTEL